MKRQHAENLLALADKLDKVSPENFDMTTWAEKRTCGTTCCALGWACTLSFAKKVGVSLKVSKEWKNYLDIRVKGDSEENNPRLAALKLFGKLRAADYDDLFMDSTVDPREKAKQIRNFVGKRFKLKIVLGDAVK